MRNLLFSLVAVGVVAGTGVPTAAEARLRAVPVVVERVVVAPVLGAPVAVETVQYYGPGWREREEWRRRRAIEFRHREEIRRREEWRAFHRPPPPPPGFYPAPLPLPRY